MTSGSPRKGHLATGISDSIRVGSILLMLVAHAGAQPANRSISFDTRYLVSGYSNQAVAQFGLDVIDLAAVPGQSLSSMNGANGSDNSERVLFYSAEQWRNLGGGLLTMILSGAIGNSYQFAFHEFGHGTRLAAAGYEPVYGHGSVRSQEEADAVLRSGDIHDNFFTYFLASLNNTSGYSLADPYRTLFEPIPDEQLETMGWLGAIAMGGVNNEMYFTERIEDHFVEKGGHIGYFVPYLSGKTAIRSYSLGDGALNDKANILNRYEQRQIDIDESDVNRGSLLALALSGTTYQLGLQIARMFAGRSTAFRSWEWHGVQVPNISSYLNTGGLSMKVRSGIRHAKWRFPIAIERQYRGASRFELSVGAIGEYGSLYPSVNMVVGKTFEPAIGVMYQITPELAAGGGVSVYDRANLNGERLIPSLDGSSRYNELYLRAMFRY